MEEVQVYYGDGDVLVLLDELDPWTFREHIEPLPTYTYHAVHLPAEEMAYRINFKGIGITVGMTMGKEFWEDHIVGNKKRVVVTHKLMQLIKAVDRDSRPLTGI